VNGAKSVKWIKELFMKRLFLIDDRDISGQPRF